MFIHMKCKNFANFFHSQTIDFKFILTVQDIFEDYFNEIVS